ncbi:uncharacterized protein LOC127000306 [Eriocheir sinensis]|uniref:uncharacterized protein LOC127000306 n=1 Tax=Eriocheir sinensis TaxID=95602 RepID=UPI0021C7D545|nr:uncharacterized protein LOC127000306 [Eriocheir sinensis]XP_050719821.1 uncharacterized protein LOC127000306 [Eriocheir sinensis]XP_050719822.1 uncharacterized protein LOC127000306 [Eriocheir sinensis]XP_050719823.1 uncharacterized protein LOC127000306 [Eriocheir sinensis]
MDSLHLRLLSIWDEVVENWHFLSDLVTARLPKRHNSVGVATGDLSHDSDGRVWVEVGGPGLRLRVIHLHPANPALAELLATRATEARQSDQEDAFKLPADDEISLASLEDYWFNHWEGPFVTADSNQNTVNFRRSRRSLRKSKRKFRCSVCNRKVVGADGLHDDGQDPQCFERENVLAHVPSVKLETMSPKLEDPAGGSSDEEGTKPTISEELLSRYSASDEQLARAHRVLDHELRTSFTLFAEEAVTQDVIDGVSMSVDDGSSSPDASQRLAPPVYSPRQSRSCPCSPKLSSRNHSPKSNAGSPKPQSRSGSSKFSLSSSLMAIHRQASNSLRTDFLKFDSGKSDFGGSKSDSQQSSLRNELRYTKSSADAQMGNFDTSLAEQSTSDSQQETPKNALHESHSLPTLKLAKMSMTYKGGVVVNHEREANFGQYSDTTKLITEGACALPSTPEDTPMPEGLPGSPQLLPDVVPRYGATSSPLSQILESKPTFSVSSSPDSYGACGFDQREGIINLGFDGHEESSDFADLNEFYSTKGKSEHSPSLWRRRGSGDSDIDIGKSNIQMNIGSVHAISIGHSPQGQDVALSLEVPPVQNQDQGGKGASNGCENSDNASCSSATTASTASPSASPHINSADGLPTAAHRIIEEADEEEESMPYDHMHVARQMVFWWQKPNTSNDEFCQNSECKVKQKPLLLFLHGMGSSSDHWRRQLWYFVTRGYEVVAPDLMGHGLSSAPKDAEHYTFSQMLDQITLVFDLFVPQGRKCVVIGHGYGCSLAAALARGRVSSVRLVILASCGGPSPLIPNPPNKSFLHSRLATFLSPFLACGCCSREILHTPRGKHFAVNALSGSSITPTPRYVLENVARGQNWPEGDVAFHRRITVPTLLLHGMKDDRVTLVEMCEMERTIPRAFLEMVPGGGHDLMLDAPVEVSQAVHRFIKRWNRQM